VIVVDDGSPDDGDVADHLASEFPGRIEVVHRAARAGSDRRHRRDGARDLTNTDWWRRWTPTSHDVQYLPDLIAAAALPTS
jgi:dolichol-phosphate mannosyltransferase